MITLGIDLASQPKETAACRIDWNEDRGEVVDLEADCDDARLDDLIHHSHATGIDAPLGWPSAFIGAMTHWSHRQWDNQRRDELTLRLTDREVTRLSGLRPLRVAADRIALPALRAMALLHRHGVADRSGPPGGSFFEVYPAGSLKQWGLLGRPSYRGKGSAAEARRTILRRTLQKRFALKIPTIADTSDHLLDAVIASITTRLAHAGGTLCWTPDQQTQAATEGWIHLPKASQ
jgi:predicted nuclease with RNAse H fold